MKKDKRVKVRFDKNILAICEDGITAQVTFQEHRQLCEKSFRLEHQHKSDQAGVHRD